jgi:hypothetical protein
LEGINDLFHLVLRHRAQLSWLKPTGTTGETPPGQSIAENEQPDYQKERELRHVLIFVDEQEHQSYQEEKRT